MSVAMLLDELLSGFAPPPRSAWSAPTPAKAANSANRKQSCGFPADSTACEGLRKAANPGPAGVAAATDSQEFAAVRNPGNRLESKQPCGFSQDSQDSQGVPVPSTICDRLAAVSWDDGDIARFIERRARLLRWGWTEDEAERLAERLVRRDREADSRVSCTDCGHYRPGRCGNHRRAGLQQPDVGRDLAASVRRCTGFESTGK